MKSLLALDPGLQGTGYALWLSRSAREHKQRRWAPDRVGVLNVSSRDKDMAWWDRAMLLAKQIAALRSSRQTRIVCEFTEYQASAHRVMAWKTGDLQRLTFLSGVIYAVTRPNPFLPVVTSGWKGQLSKAMVIERITNRFGRKTVSRLGIKTHAFDAVGIGLWALGEFE